MNLKEEIKRIERFLHTVPQIEALEKLAQQIRQQEDEETIGFELLSLIKDQAEWSEKTFGTNKERGPLGPLKHLEKEAKEAQNNPADILEYADCFILILDASRRTGFSISDLIQAAKEKMIQNKEREWGPRFKDQAIEHIK